MSSWTRRPFLLSLFSFVSLVAPASGLTPEEEAAEAQRLYDHATAYVTNIQEGAYSYAYLQFYWKRAQANIERAMRTYPQTAIGKQLRDGALKLGPYELDYFRDRVLPRLEVKRLAAFDAVNCSVLLYNLDRERWDERRAAAFHRIQEVLVRQRRYREALGFPVREGEETNHLVTIFRAAVYDGQDDVVNELLADAPEEALPLLRPLLAEGIVLLGRSRTELAELIDEHDDEKIKLAALTRMVDREILIQRAATLRLDIRDRIQTTHFKILQPETRDDIA
ncbi:MAG TPA: hypothetical protein VHF69_08100, partial [Candidatus Synoicihabitans sp.]|nr:hypothetical protein [Candidatus Synoicihabitans sp.]